MHCVGRLTLRLRGWIRFNSSAAASLLYWGGACLNFLHLCWFVSIFLFLVSQSLLLLKILLRNHCLWLLGAGWVNKVVNLRLLSRYTAWRLAKLSSETWVIEIEIIELLSLWIIKLNTSSNILNIFIWFLIILAHILNSIIIWTSILLLLHNSLLINNLLIAFSNVLNNFILLIQNITLPVDLRDISQKIFFISLWIIDSWDGSLNCLTTDWNLH